LGLQWLGLKEVEAKKRTQLPQPEVKQQIFEETFSWTLDI
jgi:hypothetical protein